MKKNQTVQGTFSKLFGKKHTTSPSTSLYATNPPWIFTQEAPEEGTRGFDGIYYGDNRFNTVSESGTATLKARPRVRPLLTFLPLNAQENHGLAVPTPSVPEDFADKEVTGTSSLVNGNLRLYSSVGDLRPGQYGQDLLIPPPPPGPAPGPPQDISQPPGGLPLPSPPSTAPPPPPLLPPPLPPAAPPLPCAQKAAHPPAGFTKPPKSSSPALKPKPNPPSPADTASSAPADWRDPSQMEKLRNELAAYLCGSRREDRFLSHRPGPTMAQSKEGKKGPSMLEKETPPSPPAKDTPPGVPEKSLGGSSLTETEATPSLTLPPVDYLPQDSPTPSVRQIRNELEARLSSSAEKEAKPSIGSLPPKPRLEGGRIFENGADNDKLSKPVVKNLPPQSTTLLPTTPLQPKAMLGPATPPKATSGSATPPKATPGPTTPPKATSGPTTPLKATAGPATPPKATSGLAIPSTATTLPTTTSQLMAEKDSGPAGQPAKPASQEVSTPSQPRGEGSPSEATRLPTQGAHSSPALPPKTSPGEGEVPCLYKPHCHQSSLSLEVAVVMPTLARGGAAGPGEPVEVKEPPGLPAKPSVSAQPTDELLRHPVTGEVVERGSPMALLLAARQRAQKGRPGGAALGRSSLPGSLRDHSQQAEASSDSIFHSQGRPNCFTVVPKLPKEAEKDSPLTTEIPNKWGPRPGRDAEGTERSRRHNWTKLEPQAPVAWERAATSNLPQGHPLPKSFSSPPSPSYKREEEEEEFNFEVIPPPPEFSNDPEPPAPALQYLGRRSSPPRNNYSGLGQPPSAGLGAPPALGFSRFPAGARYAGAGGLERFSGGGRSLIKKRLYVGEPHRDPGLPRGGTGRSLSPPNCFRPQPGGPEMRRVNSAGRAPPGGLHARRLSLEGAARGAAEAKHKAHGSAPAAGRSPHTTTRYGSPINTFTVRPGTRHPISYACSGAHRKATS
ncbi:PREDICTED: uncharacterized protein C6orf132 homolog [Rhinopithecus bieti]|uniref:Chromosome 6 open reading frame 132 n=1 Tax=Rhinopithecus bieti TaxID=61621 RepID=A0A2K6ME14_RHIBE|nr:PREDICTED: uncharacterized protein C6orf132 homolog [Rhinopithecus bieti]